MTAPEGVRRGTSGTARAFLAPLVAIVAPETAFRWQRSRPQPGPVIGSILILTLASSYLLVPILTQLAGTLPGVEANAPVLRNAIALRLFVIAPFDTALFLLVVSGLTWAALALAGWVEGSFSACLVVVFTAGVTQILRRVFVVVVLALRGGPGAAAGDANVFTGLDAFFEVFRSGPRLLVSIATHVSVFDLWFVILIAMGLRLVVGVRSWVAAVTAASAYGVVAAMLVAVDLFAGR